MRFVVHGKVPSTISTALARHEQDAHTLEELLASTEGVDEDAIVNEPKPLMALIQKKQWNLITSDADFVRNLYEQKVIFNGSIVLLLVGESEEGASASIDRLFERYKRLTPKRMYTVTESRVKVRQLPGANDL